MHGLLGFDSGTTRSEATVDAGRQVSLDSGCDTSLVGSQVSAGNDLRNIGGAISAGGDASLQAGNDLILGSAEAENRQNKW